jgi:hypothetical protein
MLASASVLNLVMLLALSGTPGGAAAQASNNNVTRSPHGNLNVPCQNCHTASAWKPIRAVPEFDHNQTKYPLRGMHAAVTCTQCHVKMVFNNVGHACQDCHADIHRRQLGANCEQCHTVRGWQVAVQNIKDHNNRFPLTGAHAAVDCDACHKNGANSNFQTMSTECYSCHQSDYTNTTNPKHTANTQAFPVDQCDTCHTTDNWLNAKFDHNATGFALTGMHTVPPRACADCHVNNNYNLTSTTCYTCHQADYLGTTNPKHNEQSFPDAQCSTCHNTSSWANANFDHSLTGFPLTGQHTVPPRQCGDCHTNNNYNLTSTTCVTCHLKDFDSTTNPNHVSGGFAQTCETCHTTSAWQPATFDHSKTAFPLTGMHTVPPRQCTDCHVNNNYNITNTTCVSCHQTDYNNATTPVAHAAAGFPTTCENCHDTTAWTDGTFNHQSTGFALTGQHTVPPRACVDCHTNNNYSLNSAACVTCHLKDYQGTTNPNHVTASFPQTCDQCHSTTNWTSATFDHSSTGFALTGAHTVPPRSCTDCHVNNNYSLNSTACVSCHLKDYQGTTNPNHVSSNFPQTCDQCHSTATWSNAAFDHNNTGFPLTGSHTVPPRACTDCHVNNNYTITNTTCVSCHQTDYNNATSPVAHAAAGFPTTCENCHDTVQWTDGTFNHASTGFTLTGMHTVPPRVCADCHTNNNYSLNSTACVTCHLKDYQGTTNPNHVTASFPQTCDQCHSTTNWTSATFDHSTTGFPLTGMHTVPPRACTDCHVNNNYSLNSTACVTCHLKDYQGTTNPNHVTANFPQTCDQCHSTANWTSATFDHSTTGFPLTGAHTVPPRACTDCHVNNNYNLTSTACVTCHLTDYNSTTNPNHVTAGFPQTCQTCHDTTVWTDSTFNHSNTGFPLTGSHTVPPRQCTDCHINNNYNLTSTTCVSCHQTDYNNATTPVNHIQANFPTTCQNCHDTVAWTDGTFNHSSTGFTLTGSHTVPPRQCTDCHINGNYNLTSTTCVSCHQTDYNNATTPVNHVAANFPTTCETCHDTVQWTDGTFNHASTGFTLTGAHTVPPRACTDCHKGSNPYGLNSTACVTCHLADYNSTTNPNHVTAGFPQQCDLCHDTTVWTDSTFNHNNTAFPLTGSHTVPPRVCTDCHVNGNYTTLPTTCIGCHQTDYNNTTNPSHSTPQNSAFFPTASCSTCHTTTAWTNATFNHTQYTQFSTSHGNAGGVCATCHTNTSDYSVFQCTGCHGGNNSANFHHENVPGYVYNSVNCYQCHQSGGGG